MNQIVQVNLLKNPAHNPETINQDIEYVANKLDVSPDEIMLYLNQENRSFKDYKNQQMIYDFGAKLMRQLGLERGGKR